MSQDGLSKFPSPARGTNAAKAGPTGEGPAYPTAAAANHGAVNVLKVGAGRHEGGAHYIAPGWLTLALLQGLGTVRTPSLEYPYKHRFGGQPAGRLVAVRILSCVFAPPRILPSRSLPAFRGPGPRGRGG